MFRRNAFVQSPDEERTFLELALNARQWWQEKKVTTDLSKLVFDELFGTLVRSLVEHDPLCRKARAVGPECLGEVKKAALVLLYRLLFVLYAEDRNLLPVNEQPYKRYSLRHAVRLPVEELFDQRLRPSQTASRFYASTKDSFRAIDEGDEALRLPPYNGRLFDLRRAPILERTSLPDSVFAPIVDKLSRLDLGLFKRRINYRDLSVRQLGSIYERLLEYDAVQEDGEIKVRLQPFARKDSGSYYTPDELVLLIIEKTIGPLVDERWQVFVVRIEELRGEKRPKAERLDLLAEVDPAMAMLDLKICDPAMGSGHFLVALVDYLADQILEAARALFGWSWTGRTGPRLMSRR